MENEESGKWECGNEECGKLKKVENVECGKRGVWKMREKSGNEECGK